MEKEYPHEITQIRKKGEMYEIAQYRIICTELQFTNIIDFSLNKLANKFRDTNRKRMDCNFFGSSLHRWFCR
jgi:hypothetical protein